MSALRIFTYGDKAIEKWCYRRPCFDGALVSAVATIIQEVEDHGANAVLEHTRRFDAQTLDSLFVSADELAEAHLEEDEHADAIRTAIERVKEFHLVQLETMTEGWTEIGSGWGWRTYSHEHEDGRETGMIGQRMLPVSSAGVYVPGGKAHYPSSVIMNVVPAQVAGVERIVVATPPNKDGDVSTAVLFACRELGVECVFKAGGASAIAAMALGIEGVPRVDVIAGPGNSYVTESKRQFWGTVGLDSFAGPSEVCVLADESANAAYAAADLIAQVEHAPDNVALLVTTSKAKCDEIIAEIDLQVIRAPRAQFIREALLNHSAAIVCGSIEEAVETVNRFAPEHLALHVDDPASLLPNITNASAVMMGPWTAQSVGDYCEGPSHTLPTSGAARFASPVSVATFLKLQSVSMLDQEDAEHLAPIAQAFAEMEGLPAHAAAATLRTTSSEPE